MTTDGIRKPKHRRIFEHIHEAIVEGHYAGGERLPTDAQLMRQFKASRPTVARAMRDLEQAGFVERRPGSGSFVRLSRDPKSIAIGLLIPGLGETEIFEPICGQIARACQRHNFSLVWGDPPPSTTSDKEKQAEALCRWYSDQRVAGVFFAPVELTPGMDVVNRKVAEALDKAGVVVILLDRDVEKFPQRSKFDLVGIDNFRAGYVQAEHMLSLGCRKVIYLSRPLSASTVDARIAGYRHALKAYDVVSEDGWILRGEPDDLEFVRTVVRQNPEAILCANDFTAAKLMHSLIRLGVSVPKDIRVMGMDDVKYAQLLSTPLTTLHQPCRAIGEAALGAMVQRLENRGLPTRDILLDFQLVVRESCGATL